MGNSLISPIAPLSNAVTCVPSLSFTASILVCGFYAEDLDFVTLVDSVLN